MEDYLNLRLDLNNLITLCKNCHYLIHKKEMNRNLNSSEKMLERASNFIGVKEIKGNNHNPIILRMFDEIGHDWVKDDETAWCTAFINYIAYTLDLSRSNKLDARSWLEIGEDIVKPVPGDIVIFWRESKESWKGHVGLFVGYDSNKDIFCLGGNQNNEVNIKTYPKERLLGFKRL